MSEISVTVLESMQLAIHPHIIAVDGDHNSATFKIMSQPASLDALACRAEVQNANGEKTYRLVVDGEFMLSNDIAVAGTGYLQLVYSDGDVTTRKTNTVSFNVLPSIDAVDESDPEFSDGLAQLQTAAFVAVRSPTPGQDIPVATFINLAGQDVGALIFPPALGGGDLTEQRADTLYLRLNGLTPMQNSVRIDGPNRGMIWEDSGVQGALYSTGSQLVLRLPQGDPPFVIEPNSGSAGLRSPVLTQQAGDTAYARLTGAQFTGPLITQPGNSVTNPGVGIGDNTTGFYRAGTSLLLGVSGQLYIQYLGSPASMMMVVPINMATQTIQSMGDPRDGAAGAQDAVNRRTMEAAIAAIPRPAVPAVRTYIANEVTITPSPQVFFDQPFFTNDNSSRTILVMVHPQYDGGTPSAFYDLEYTTGLSVGLLEKLTVYPTAQGFMGGAGVVCFAATVTPVSSQIQVQLSVRQATGGTNALVQIGSRTTQRSYVVIQEMTQ